MAHQTLWAGPPHYRDFTITFT